jgi:WD40 repeat protein
VLSGHTAPVVGVDYHPSKNIVATCALSEDSSIRLWASNGSPNKDQ